MTYVHEIKNNLLFSVSNARLENNELSNCLFVLSAHAQRIKSSHEKVRTNTNQIVGSENVVY